MKKFYCLILFMVLSCYNVLWSQNGTFKHFNIQDGIIQSQVFDFVQDQRDFLWIATLGGISIFDGTDMEYLTKKDGLPSNVVYKLFRDTKNRIWMATSKGIVYFDGKKLQPVQQHFLRSTSNIVNNYKKFLECNGQLFFLDNGNIYKLNGNSFDQLLIDDWILDGFVKGKTVYLLSLQNGLLETKKTDKTLEAAVKLDANYHLGDYYLLMHHDSQSTIFYGNKGLVNFDFSTNHVTENTKWKQIAQQGVFGFFKDSRGGEWLSASNGGIYYAKEGKIIFYGKNNGLTNNEVFRVFEDNQRNIWIGSNGDGIYRFNYGPFYLYSKDVFFNGNNISDVAYNQFNNQLYIATSKGELFQMTKDAIATLKLNQTFSAISELQLNASKELILVNPLSGIYAYQHQWSQLAFKDSAQKNSNAYAYENFGTTEAAIVRGTLWLKRGKDWEKTTYQTTANNFKFFDNNTLIFGTDHGAVLYDVSTAKERGVVAQGSAIYDIAANTKQIFVATDDKGLVIYNTLTQQSDYIDESKGLSCGFVYSLWANDTTVWIGTGCGVDKLDLLNVPFVVTNYSAIHGWEAIESNVGAIQKVNQTLYFGTNAGLLTLNSEHEYLTQFEPKIILKKILVFSKEIDLTPYARNFYYDGVLPQNPIFPSNFTHLTFDIKAVILGVEKIKYRYQLLGTNDDNIYETDQSTIVLSNLTPGKYSLNLWSTNSYGQWGDTFYQYKFEILTPFTQTWYFKLAIIFVLIACYFFVRWWLHQQKLKRMAREMELKQEEQDRVKQRTAEDFHDEIGNNLTKINLLSSMAKAKSSADSDVYTLLNQIQTQTQALYKGAKDIIWSLQPQSNLLHHIIDRVTWNAEEMMQLAKIQFSVSTHFDANVNKNEYQTIKMEDEVSRNVILIFKEVFNNIIKYAAAEEVTMQINIYPKHLVIRVVDKGKGFDIVSDPTMQSNGIKNMQRRSERIHAQFTLNSQINVGTEIDFVLPYK